MGLLLRSLRVVAQGVTWPNNIVSLSSSFEQELVGVSTPPTHASAGCPAVSSVSRALPLSLLVTTSLLTPDVLSLGHQDGRYCLCAPFGSSRTGSVCPLLHGTLIGPSQASIVSMSPTIYTTTSRGERAPSDNSGKPGRNGFEMFDMSYALPLASSLVESLPCQHLVGSMRNCKTVRLGPCPWWLQLCRPVGNHVSFTNVAGLRLSLSRRTRALASRLELLQP